MKKVVVQHFMKNGENTFTETWKLKRPLSGDYKEDKARLKKLVQKDAHKPHEKFATAYLVVSWGEQSDNTSFLLEVK